MPAAVESRDVIVFEDVHCRRGGHVVLQGINFRVSAGEVVVFVGRSGAGKSTVVKLINRILMPMAGRVLVHDRDTAVWNSTALRLQTGYVLQEVGLFPHMSVRRNVGIVPMLAGWTRQMAEARTHELLNLVGLPAAEFADRWPDELSGGERQRVGVARALAADPSIVLMDEPFGALDPLTRAELHREFVRIQQQVQKTVVIVTHDMREAFALADRIGVLDDRQLVAYDTPQRLRASTDRRVRPLLDAAFDP